MFHDVAEKLARRAASQRGPILSFVVLAAAAILAMFPILWGLSTSLKSVSEVTSVPPTWVPETITLNNYGDVISQPRLWIFLLNTFIVIGLSLAVSLLLSTHAAWAVVRRRFRGKNTMLFAIWATIMIPSISTLLPLYLIAVEIGLYNTYTVLIVVYSASAVPTLVWLMRGFIAAVPSELEEAARIDGCSTAGAFYRITVPLLRPGMLAGGVMVFLMIWNEFLIGYGLVISDNRRIIQAGLYSFITDAGIEWGPMMAGIIISLLPVLIIYSFVQKYFVKGLTGGAIKG